MFDIENPFLRLQEEFSTSYKIDKFVKNSPYYIQPVTVKLKPDSDGKRRSFQRIPLIQLIEKLVAQPGFTLPAPSSASTTDSQFGGQLPSSASTWPGTSYANSSDSQPGGQLPGPSYASSSASQPGDQLPGPSYASSSASQPGDQVSRSSERVCFRDITDGSAYIDNIFFRNNPDALGLILYSDEADPCNPIGAAKGKHKILNVYGTFVQIPKSLR